MICPDCVKGMVVELRTKGQVHPYRETSILTYPEKYIKKVLCQSCNGSGVRYHGGDTSCKADKHFGEPHTVEQQILVHS